ncbi:hypothetical protein BB558_006382 [Smittium angustum]|uniref:Sec20 C-terminal domain-containing protein n=1 Tax=Smittium angustum TaxID=133377 RepID=A0A2U1IXV8_SMIAN|nr:hypothetical protein BB558_006382 [Smittium angustum]
MSQEQLISEQLAVIENIQRQLQDRIDELYEYIGLDSKRQELMETSKELLKQMEFSIKEFEMEFEDEITEQTEIQINGQTLNKTIKSKYENLRRLQREYREAVVQTKQNKYKQAVNERELLLSGALSPSEFRKRKARTGNELVGAAQDTTDLLRETTQIMARELEVGVNNVAALEESSRLLKKTTEEHKSVGVLLGLSKKVLTELEKADWVDRMLILLALILFSFVSFNILRKRIWIPGLATLIRSLRKKTPIQQPIKLETINTETPITQHLETPVL